MSAPAVAPLPGAGRGVALALLLLAGTAWGGVFTANRLAADAGIPPVAYVFWSTLLAGVALAVLSALVDGRPRLGRPYLVFYVVAGLLNIGAGMVLFAWIAPRLPAGVTTLAGIMSPTMTWLFSVLLRLDRFRWVSVAGLVLGAAGIVVIVVPEFSLPDPDMAGWFLLALLAPVSFACGNIYVALGRPPEGPSLMMAAGLAFGAALCMLPAQLFIAAPYDLAAAPGAACVALAAAALVHAVVLSCFIEVVRRAGPVFFSQVGYVAVVAGILWGIAVFGETHSVWVWSGAALLVGGLALVNAGTRARLAAADERVTAG